MKIIYFCIFLMLLSCSNKKDQVNYKTHEDPTIFKTKTSKELISILDNNQFHNGGYTKAFLCYFENDVHTIEENLIIYP